MTTWVAFLRAINVGGSGLLRMRDLRALSEGAGLAQVRTHGASGNTIFKVDAPEEEIRTSLAQRLEGHLGRPTGVILRTAGELEAILAANPFPEADASRVVVFLLDTPPPPDALQAIAGQEDEVVALGRREIFVHYPHGMGLSRLRIPAAKDGTARNINTLRRLAAMLDLPAA